MSELTGALRERVAVERWVGASDGAGGSTGTWTALAEVWASVEAAGFGAAIEAERVNRAARYRVTVRALDELRMGDRLIWRGQPLEVLSLERDPSRPERITMLVEETGG